MEPRPGTLNHTRAHSLPVVFLPVEVFFRFDGIVHYVAEVFQRFCMRIGDFVSKTFRLKQKIVAVPFVICAGEKGRAAELLLVAGDLSGLDLAEHETVLPVELKSDQTVFDANILEAAVGPVAGAEIPDQVGLRRPSIRKHKLAEVPRCPSFRPSK